MKKVAKILLYFWLSLGMVGLFTVFICSGLAYCGVQGISTKISFPIAEVTSSAVDKQGRVFSYSGSLCRLQIFDNRGGLLRGWFVYTAFSTGRIYTDSNAYVHVVSSADNHFVFDYDGNKIRESKDKGCYDIAREMKKSDVHYRDSKSNIYKADHGILRTKILRTTPTGQESLVVTDPLYLIPFAGSRSLVLFLAPSVFIMVGVTAWKERKQKRKQTVVPPETPSE